MKRIKLFIAAAFILSSFIATAGGKKIEVNGEKIVVEDGIYGKFETTLGDILIQFSIDKAPMTAANFILLAEGKMPGADEKYKDVPYYNGLTFHRVIPNFMIQGGDPEGNGQGGPGYEFPNETHEDLSHSKGVISMANAGPNTNGSQFFITVAETKQLDGSYSVFGHVIEGQDVADSISNVARNKSDKPEVPVVMNTVTIVRVGKEFKSWDAVAAFTAGKAAYEAEVAMLEEKRIKEQQEALEKSKQMVVEFKQKYPEAKTSPTGLMYVIESIGEGEKPANGTNVNVHYAGYFADGKLFDTSIKSLAQETGTYNPQREPYSPMAIPYGPEAQLIPGFKEGLALLNVGGKAKLIIPPSLAYGEQGAGGIIPPHAWLIFDIELVDIAK